MCSVELELERSAGGEEEAARWPGGGMDSRLYWEDNCPHVKYENYNSNDGFGPARQGEGNLNFATGALHSEDDGDYVSTAYLKKGKVARQDPMSHRVIEKRRRDRMNNCLADLSRLIPPDYLKKGRGRVEKTEIIEMAIRHLKYLQDRTNGLLDSKTLVPKENSYQQSEGPISAEHFRLGFQECRSEVMRYLVEGQGCLPSDSLCVQLVGHLHRHCDNIMKGDQLNKPRSNPETTSSSSGSSNNNYSGVVKQTVIALAQRTAHPSRPAHPAPEPPSCAASPDPADDYERYRPREPTLRNIRKLEHANGEDYADQLHSYKFKNTIKQRFSQDVAHDMSLRHGKRCRSLDIRDSSGSLTSNDEGVCRDASPHLTPADPPPPLTPAEPSLCIPVFALNTRGKYYVPLNVNYECLASFLGPYDLLDGANGSPLHPVSINVNFQPYLEHMKAKPESEPDWRPV